MSHGTPGRAGREGLGGRPGWCPPGVVPRVWYTPGVVPEFSWRVFLESPPVVWYQSFPGEFSWSPPGTTAGGCRSGVVQWCGTRVFPQWCGTRVFLESSRIDGGRVPQWCGTVVWYQSFPAVVWYQSFPGEFSWSPPGTTAGGCRSRRGSRWWLAGVTARTAAAGTKRSSQGRAELRSGLGEYGFSFGGRRPGTTSRSRLVGGLASGVVAGRWWPVAVRPER
jgi:hypothetical protein